MRRIAIVVLLAMLALTGCNGSQDNGPAAKDPSKDILNNPTIPGNIRGHGTMISPSVRPTRSGQKVCQMLMGEQLCMVYVSTRKPPCPTGLTCNGFGPESPNSILKDGSSVSWRNYFSPDSYTVVRDGETLRQIVKRFESFERESDPTNVCVFSGSGSASKQILPPPDAPLVKGTLVFWC